MDVDPPDDFFELTTDDLIRMQQQANEKKKVSCRHLDQHCHSSQWDSKLASVCSKPQQQLRAVTRLLSL
jgi:hypothetical protein